MQQFQLPCPNNVDEVKPNVPAPVRKRYWQMKPKRNILLDNLSLAEAARLELAVVPSKTPVTILQELLCKRGTVPKYELVQIEGAIHEPTFRYRVAFGDTVASGTGRSKKEAKHAAAKNVLLKLVGNVSEEPAPDANPTEPPPPIPNLDEKISGNPIGTLQEMCMAKRWPPPTYEMVDEEGLPHERLFTIECTLLEFKEVGTGKSKKLAKRQAANKMWEKLQECNSEPPSPTADVPAKPGPSVRYAELKTNKINTLSSPHCHKVSVFHKNLKQSVGDKVDELQMGVLSEPDFDFAKFLNEIAYEQQFEITYVDIDERSASGLYQCLVQLSTFPIAVCYGSGEDMEEAQAGAAQNALEYLRIMTKK